ncbi:rieske [2Fe-2S] domain protein [Cooperia oncophora]
MATAETEIDTSPRVTEVLGKADEVPPGMKKTFLVKDKPILVINDNGTLYGISGLIYCDGRIRCTLHGACYNVKTGELEDYPALDSLYTYDVSINKGLNKAPLSSVKKEV